MEGNIVIIKRKEGAPIKGVLLKQTAHTVVVETISGIAEYQERFMIPMENIIEIKDTKRRYG